MLEEQIRRESAQNQVPADSTDAGGTNLEFLRQTRDQTSRLVEAGRNVVNQSLSMSPREVDQFLKACRQQGGQ